MNSKGHLIMSLIKSVSRIIGTVFGVKKNIIGLSVCFGVAELLGIAEELVDKR